MRIIHEFDGPVTRAIALAEPDNALSVAVGLHGEGTARCKPGDHYDRAIGAEIAAGRAIADLGAKLAERASGLSITEEQATRHALTCFYPSGVYLGR